MFSRLPRLILLIGLYGIAIGLVEYFCRRGWIPEILLPPPLEIGERFVTSAHDLLGDVLVTLIPGIMGLFGGIVLGILLGLVASDAGSIRRALINPIIVVFEAVPKIVLVPIILVAVGRSNLAVARIVMAIIFVVYPVYNGTISGLARDHSRLHPELRVYEIGYFRELINVRLPFAAGEISAGINAGSLLWLVGVVVLEALESEGGLGNAFMRNYGSLQSPVDGYVTIVWMILIALASYSLVRFLTGILVRRLRLSA